jgi:hypothetical protein
MNKELVLMEVVAYLEAEIKSDREYLASDSADSLSFEEDFAMTSTICRLERIVEHFQEQIERGISAFETSQGM